MTTVNNGSADAVPPPFADTALALSSQEWSLLGLDNDDENLSKIDLLESLIERVTAVLLVRIVAMLAKRIDKETRIFPDLSSSTICRTVLVHQKPWVAYAPGITNDLLAQLKGFVRVILMGYNDTPYHCKEHALHVILSVNKLTNLMLQTDPGTVKTFGLRHDTIAQFALVFAALIHDVEHKGVPNRQLVLENDSLAVLYNDHSVAEQRSLFVAFDLLLKPEFTVLRSTLFDFKNGSMDSDDYRHFRKIVIDLVLNTDIASPERMQLQKSKWKEAFGDPFETMERKLKMEMGVDEPIQSGSESETPESSDNEDESERAASVSSVSVGYKYSPSELGYEVHHGKDEVGNDGVIVSGSTLPGSKPNRGKSVVLSPRSNPAPRRRTKHSHSMPMGRRGSVQLLLQSDEYCNAKFQRRMSSYATPVAATLRPENFRKRLGIRRSMDLSGEEIEAYLRPHTDGSVSDEVDEFKAFVVMETIMTAADVAHNLQGWEQMVIWSGRLYLELRKAFVDNRGGDPQIRWFENQIGFLESYLLPLARRLEDTGVFGDGTGQMFARTVEANRDKWLVEGMEVTELVVEKGAEEYN